MLTIVERHAMAPEEVASTALFQAGLKTSGHAGIPRVLLDTGKGDLNPQSDAAVVEVARLLTADSTLKRRVVGQADHVASKS